MLNLRLCACLCSQGAAALSAARAAKQPAAPVVAAALPASAAASRQAAWAKTGSVALRDAGLQDVPADVWAVGAATRVLDLSGNPALRGVGEQLGSLHALTRLQLCGCGLLAENIAWSALCRLSSLTTLALDHNALTALPDSLGSLRSLRQLSASHNALRSLPASVGQLSALTVLTLDGNALTALPDELGSCAELEELHVRRNALTALPPALGAGCLRLAVLSADGNRLPAAGIPPALLRAPALHTLSLHENPVTIEQLRELDGWGELDERRRAKANKAISARVLDASASFDEGADASAFRKF